MLLPLFPHMQLPLLPPNAELLSETCEHSLIRDIGGLPSRTTVEILPGNISKGMIYYD